MKEEGIRSETRRSSSILSFSFSALWGVIFRAGMAANAMGVKERDGMDMESEELGLFGPVRARLDFALMMGEFDDLRFSARMVDRIWHFLLLLLLLIGMLMFDVYDMTDACRTGTYCVCWSP